MIAGFWNMIIWRQLTTNRHGDSSANGEVIYSERLPHFIHFRYQLQVLFCVISTLEEILQMPGDSSRSFGMTYVLGVS